MLKRNCYDPADDGVKSNASHILDIGDRGSHDMLIDLILTISLRIHTKFEKDFNLLRVTSNYWSRTV